MLSSDGFMSSVNSIVVNQPSAHECALECDPSHGRRTFNDIFWVLRSDASWKDIFSFPTCEDWTKGVFWQKFQESWGVSGKWLSAIGPPGTPSPRVGGS